MVKTQTSVKKNSVQFWLCLPPPDMHYSTFPGIPNIQLLPMIPSSVCPLPPSPVYQTSPIIRHPYALYRITFRGTFHPAHTVTPLPDGIYHNERQIYTLYPSSLASTYHLSYHLSFTKPHHPPATKYPPFSRHLPFPNCHPTTTRHPPSSHHPSLT